MCEYNSTQVDETVNCLENPSNKTIVELLTPDQHAVIVTYWVLMMLGAFCNLAVLISLTRTRHRKSRMDLLMTNLAIADVSVTCGVIPLESAFPLIGNTGLIHKKKLQNIDDPAMKSNKNVNPRTRLGVRFAETPLVEAQREHESRVGRARTSRPPLHLRCAPHERQRALFKVDRACSSAARRVSRLSRPTRVVCGQRARLTAAAAFALRTARATACVPPVPRGVFVYMDRFEHEN
ncbi:unnamed protein product [Parnassius apollo]|uniref:(apollo) hypothetical protein n=1 Tax=Parnassius apollo TaxID=110799 RepID=A0A8S3YH13_PARAO|nr:unnamed protein product [Parnassius apollo]